MLKMPRSRKPILPKPVFKALVWMAILLVVGGGGAAAYIWYMGKNAKFVESAAVEVPTRNPGNLLKPTQPASNNAIGVAIHALTSPVMPGSESSVMVRTRADAKCTIKVEYNKVLSKDPGLIEKIADEYGMVDWAWYIEETAPEGEWPVRVDCFYGDKSAMVIGKLIVGEPKEE